MNLIVEAVRVKPKTTKVLGVSFATMSFQETLDEVVGLTRCHGSYQVCTANASSLVDSHESRALRGVYQDADLVVCDSAGVEWALNRKGVEAQRIPGIELVAGLCGLGSERKLRFFFLGGKPGVALLAVKAMSSLYPDLCVVGFRDGYWLPEDEESVLEEVRASRTDILFVGTGIPRQEIFARKAKSLGVSKVSIGVGGSFDVLSGRLPRAPLFVRRIRLEWLWRMVLEPRRFGDLWKLARFIRLVKNSGE